MVVATWNAACFHVPLPPSASTATSLLLLVGVKLFSGVIQLQWRMEVFRDIHQARSVSTSV